jgi:hypothetical protein
MAHLGDEPQALARLIESLGGTITSNDSFSFPVNQTKDIVPKLDQVGIGVRRVQEYVSTNPRSGKIENVCVARAYRKEPDEKG